MKPVSVNIDQMQVFVMINKDGMKINVDENAANQLTKKYVIKDLFGILAIVNVNVINHVMMENIQIIKTVSAEKGQVITQLKNVMKMLMRKDYIQRRFIIQL